MDENLAILEADGGDAVVNFLRDGSESDAMPCVAVVKTEWVCVPVDQTLVCHPHPQFHE